MKRFQLIINILSPVHIGCGTDYDPTSYVIDADEGLLYGFNVTDFAETLNPGEHQNISEISDLRGRQALGNMRSFIHKHKDRIKPLANHRVPVARGFSREYRNVVAGTGSGRPYSQLEVARTFFNPISNEPIIPGSSIKGAIRTAVLSHLNDGNPSPDKKHYASDLLGGTFSEDPFRLVKIQDANHKPKEDGNLQKVVYAVNKYRTEDGELLSGRGIATCLEVIQHQQANGCSFVSTLTFPSLGNVSGKVPDNDKRWGFGGLASMCNEFYRPKLEKELDILKMHNGKWVRSIRLQLSTDQVAGRLSRNTAFILRVGHHSGAECVTMDGARRIMIRRGRGQKSFEKEPTTKWFATDDNEGSVGLLPFGWLLVIVTKAQ
ncbi:MAG: RAMP superfamily CRISPR-associated protein [Planctomycetota bacterium]|nr:RAMP superfamily CRISPR-associated protein [Planctomycetota bacterium]